MGNYLVGIPKIPIFGAVILKAEVLQQGERKHEKRANPLCNSGLKEAKTNSKTLNK